MKNLVLTSLGMSVLVSVSGNAFASDDQAASNPTVVAGSSASETAKPFTQEQIDYIKKELSKKDPSTSTASTTFYGLVQLNANTSDTQRSNVPDFTPAHVRLGTKINGGIASGQVEVELIGNQPSGAASKTDPISGASINSTPPNNGVVIRQAQLNLDVLKVTSGENSYSTTVSLGGVRIGGAVYITPDITNEPAQFSRQDGAYVQEKVSVGKNLIVNVGFGVFNSLFANSPGNNGYTGWDNGAGLAQQSLWGSPSLSQSLAYVGTFNTTYKFDSARTFNLALFAGSQKNAPSVMNGSGGVVDKRDISHIEGSLYYNDTQLLGSKGVISGNGVSFWYEREANGRSQVASTSNVGYVDDSEVATLYGLGIGADSSPYLSGMIQKDDRLTYAASYTLVTNYFENTTNQQSNITLPPTTYTNQNYKLYQLAASIGYAVSTFEVALNAEYSKSDTQLFVDSKGNSKTAEMKSYITAAYVF